MKVIVLLLYFAVLIGIGFYCRKHATDVNGFVLGGRNVGPWLTAFAYGTSYFSAVVFVGYAGQFGWNTELPPPGPVSEMPLSDLSWPGLSLAEGPGS